MTDTDVSKKRSSRTYLTRDWTKGSIIRNLLSLSWPIMISDGLRTVGPTIDMIWVGKLGTAAVAGVGVSSMAILAVMVGMMGLNAGMRALIARFMGASDTESANHVAQQSLVVSAVYAAVIALIGILYAEPILSLFGLEADVITEGAAYMRITFAGTAVLSFGMMAEGIMQSSGDAVTPMRISVFYRILHIALCPFLIFGWWIFPRMGVSGAAISSIVAQGLGMVIALLVLYTGRSRLRLSMKNLCIDFKTIWRMVRIAIPISLAMVERAFGRLAFVWLMAPFGTVAVAAHSIIERIEVFLTTPAFGFGRGGGVLVGQNLGARQPERAERSAWMAVGVVQGIMVIAAVVLLVWPEPIIRFFSTDPELVSSGSIFLMIMVAGIFGVGFDCVLSNCLAGSGDTLPTMFVTLLTMVAVPLPLGLILPDIAGLGVYGVRWAIVIGMIVGAIGYTLYFRLGRWKRKMI